MMRSAAIAAVAVLVSGLPGTSQGSTDSDRFLGTWTLERARSHYAEESPPDRMTLVIEPATDGLAYRSDTTFHDGRTSATSFVARLDGTPALVVGVTGFLVPVSLSFSSDGGIDAVYTLGMKKVGWSHWSLNRTGTELLVATTYLNSKGRETKNAVAYRKATP